MADDVVAALRALGPVVERPNTYGAGTGVTYHPEHLKVVWERLAQDAGVTVLLHAFLQAAVVRDGRVEELLVATKAGLGADRRAGVRGRLGRCRPLLPRGLRVRDWPGRPTRPRR